MNLETTATTLVTPQSVFGNRNFLLLFSGKVISQLGDHIYAFALSWYILDLTKSSFQMAIFLIIDTLVVAAISPFGGLIADRVSRKGILVWMDVIRGIIVLLAAGLLQQHLLQIWMLYLSAMLLGFCGAVFSPAASAIIPNIVEEQQLTQAMSANQFSMSFCTMLGMLASGILYSWIGICAIFLFNAISFLISGVMAACVVIPEKTKQAVKPNASLSKEAKKAITDLKEGYRYVQQNQAVYALFLMNALFNLFALPIVMVYLPYLFNVILKATPLQLALPRAAVWIGMIAGSVVVSIFLQRYKLKTLIFWGLLIISVYTFITTPLPILNNYVNNWVISLGCTIGSVICGIAVSFFTIPMYVLFQKQTTDEYRGRFWGFENSLRTFAMCSGFFLAGFLAQRVWLGFLFLGTAMALFSIDVWAINLQAIKELQD
jgi:DHA3 family macrolide efflux protein-like MFS transporter